MFYPTMGLSSILILTLLLTITIYGKTVSKDSNTMPLESSPPLENNKNQSRINHIDDMLKKKQALLLKTQKSHTTQYASLYDDIAELTISKNKLLLDMNRVDDIDTDKTCDLALQYEEIEFIKTQYYKTPFDDDVARTVQNVASLYQQCHPPMAEKYLKSVLTIKENIYGKEGSEAAKAHDGLGDYYRFSMANFKRAIGEYEEAKKIREQLYGGDDIRVTQNYNRLAISLFYHGQKSQAKKLIVKSVDMHKSDKNLSQLSLAKVLMESADFCDMMGEYSHALAYLKEAEEILVSLKREKSPEMIAVYESVSNIYLNQGDEKASQKYLKKASLLKK